MPRQSSYEETEEDGADDDVPHLGPSTSRNRPTVGNCVICNAPTYCFHFGVLACRGCAAFFRRSVVRGRNYKCQANGKCAISTISGDGENLCRVGRFKKCVRMGMQDDKIRLSTCGGKKGTEVEKTAIATKSPPSKSLQIIAPNDLEQKSFYDYGVLFDRILRRTIRPPQEMPPEMSLLQRMIAGVQFIRRHQTRDPVVMDDMDATQSKYSMERHLFTAADWMMHMPEFAELNMNDKYLVHKYTSFSVGRMERAHMSGLIYGKFMAEDGRMLCVIDDLMAADFLSVRMDVSFFSDHNWEDIRRYFMGIQTRLMEEIAIPMVEMRVSETELAFMLCQATWHLEGREGVSDSLLRLSQEIRDRVADELHGYYTVQEQRMQYAERLQRLMRIVANCESISRQKDSVLELTKVFDVFRIRDAQPSMIAANQPPVYTDLSY